MGGENIGWGADETKHSYIGTDLTNPQKVYFKLDTTDICLTDNYKEMVRQAAQMWSSVIEIVELPEGASTTGKNVGIINSVSLAAETYIATYTQAITNSDGHLSSWVITLNRAKNVNAKIIAHEFGHILGLVDLYDNSNNDKLMYHAPALSSAQAPTAQDIIGAKVITGSHSHTWQYKYYKTDSAGNMHRGTCTGCNGTAASYERCFYNAQNICRGCGTPYGMQPYANEYNTVTE